MSKGRPGAMWGTWGCFVHVLGARANPPEEVTFSREEQESQGRGGGAAEAGVRGCRSLHRWGLKGVPDFRVPNDGDSEAQAQPRQEAGRMPAQDHCGWILKGPERKGRMFQVLGRAVQPWGLEGRLTG